MTAVPGFQFAIAELSPVLREEEKAGPLEPENGAQSLHQRSEYLSKLKHPVNVPGYRQKQLRPPWRYCGCPWIAG